MIPVIYITGNGDLLNGVPPELIIRKPFFFVDFERAYRAALQHASIARD
jgi:hypothetical protein